MFRSLLAIVVGYLAMAVSVILMMLLLSLVFPELGHAHEQKQPPSTTMMVVIVALGFPCSILGGWLCVWLAPRKPWMHVLILAAFSIIAGMINAMWFSEPTQPGWYLASLPLVGLLGIFVGGRLSSPRRLPR